MMPESQTPDPVTVQPTATAVADTPMIAARGLHRTFGTGSRAVHAVHDASFELPRGQLCVIVGRSGSGKTSLLNLVGALDRPDAGELDIDGKPVFGPGHRPSDGDLTELRRQTIGFIFQSFALLPVLTAAENIGMPLRLRRAPVAEREERVSLLLDLVGLGPHAKQRPSELSGGQQQRVAIARALANMPRLLIADEPTGQLDRATGRSVMRLLRAIIAAEHVTALVATHDPAMVDQADRVLTLRDGKLSEV
jgi:putative ABC transport system ATP-binding protein